VCLGVPGKVLVVDGDEATFDLWGVRKVVRLDVVDEPVEPGDYVLNHVGFAIRRIPAGQAEETLALYETLLAAEDGDLMAAEVRAEVAAGGGKRDASG